MWMHWNRNRNMQMQTWWQKAGTSKDQIAMASTHLLCHTKGQLDCDLSVCRQTQPIQSLVQVISALDNKDDR
jgi:hypothetical protein